MDQAIRSLMALMKIRASDINHVSVVIVGGGNMTNQFADDNENLIGMNNFRMAINEAKKNNLNVIFAESGGGEGRKIFVNNSDYTYKVEKIPRIDKAV